MVCTSARQLGTGKRLLEAGLLTTVNMGGFMARMMRGRWPWFMRMHLHYFTRKSLAEMVRRAGFARYIEGNSLCYLHRRAKRDSELQRETAPKNAALGERGDRRRAEGICGT